MDKKRENNKFDFSTVIANVDKVKAAKAAKQKKPSTSVKPLKFDPRPEDSPLKAAIVERINAKNLTYSEIYNYCTDLKGGDVLEGQKLGYNIISGLKNRHTMIDTTFSMLCDFLGYDIMLIERKKEDEED
jgi:hypothetical protein